MRLSEEQQPGKGKKSSILEAQQGPGVDGVPAKAGAGGEAQERPLDTQQRESWRQLTKVKRPLARREVETRAPVG